MAEQVMPDGSEPCVNEWLTVSLPGGARVVVTTRKGGSSEPPFDHFNLAMHVGDSAASVLVNRRMLQSSLALPQQPVWLEQVHGVDVVDAAVVVPGSPPPRADASFTRESGVACVVMTADCLPVVMAAQDGSVVGVAHAGWKGLCNGVIEALAARMGVRGDGLSAWLGPCIGPAVYETGPEVRAAFISQDPQAMDAFIPVTRVDGTPGYLCDLYALARRRLAALGVSAISGGEHCTFTEDERFYSFRRTPRTGRFATLAWLP